MQAEKLDQTRSVPVSCLDGHELICPWAANWTGQMESVGHLIEWTNAGGVGSWLKPKLPQISTGKVHATSIFQLPGDAMCFHHFPLWTRGVEALHQEADSIQQWLASNAGVTGCHLCRNLLQHSGLRLS